MQLSDLRMALTALKTRPSPGLDARVNATIDRAIAERRQQQPGAESPKLWIAFMNTPVTKWLAAGAAVTALLAGAFVLDRTTPSAFGLEEAINAYKGVRTVHVKLYRGGESVSAEYWIESDERGQAARARFFLPQTEDGDKLITWTPERVEVWFQTKHGFLTTYGPEVQASMQSLLDSSRPETALRQVERERQKGGVIVERPNSETLVVSAKTGRSRQVFEFDPQSHLVKSIEISNVTNGVATVFNRIEYSDYNAPLDDKMFSLADQLPPEVHRADTLNQVTGVPQYPGQTDDQAAAQTVRQFFQDLMNKDYKAAGLIYGGAQEADMKRDFGSVNVTAIPSIGAPVLQTNWMPRGYQVPCQIEITDPDGKKQIAQPAPYVRPGDNRKYPDNWHITGGVNLSPPNAALRSDPKYSQLSAGEAAAAFFKACSETNWDEVLQFWPTPASDPGFERCKEYLGGLKVISLGEARQRAFYPGWLVPYKIQLPAQILNFAVANTNAARRWVFIGLFDKNLQPVQVIEWASPPPALAIDDPYGRLAPVDVVRAYVTLTEKQDWNRLGKLTSDLDVQKTREEAQDARKAGFDLSGEFAGFKVLGAAPSADGSVTYVKCQIAPLKNYQLAVRNDNPEHRFVFDGGL